MKRHITGILAFLFVLAVSIGITIFARSLAGSVDDSSVPPPENIEATRNNSAISGVVSFVQYDSTAETLTVRMKIPSDRVPTSPSNVQVVIRISDEGSENKFEVRRVVSTELGSVSNGELDIRFRQKLPRSNAAASQRNFVASGRLETGNPNVDAFRISDFGPPTSIVFAHPK